MVTQMRRKSQDLKLAPPDSMLRLTAILYIERGGKIWILLGLYSCFRDCSKILFIIPLSCLIYGLCQQPTVFHICNLIFWNSSLMLQLAVILSLPCLVSIAFEFKLTSVLNHIWFHTSISPLLVSLHTQIIMGVTVFFYLHLLIIFNFLISFTHLFQFTS